MDTIWITFQKEGVHRYMDALKKDELVDVQFLGYPHRHIFHFKIWLQVFHDDRDVEFILFKRWCESHYNTDGPLDMDYKSCEMLARELMEKIEEEYPDRYVKISVSEDNENGCEIETTKGYIDKGKFVVVRTGE